ncbi:MAG: helix-turn-helix transcriptional regulator [Clostridia bacterium]|nr:helix-turn-helix transcriptional regulator [Clostridia bacterium]
MTIGKRISESRKNLKYSQEYLAEQLGVSRQAVSKWEQDISKPDTSNIIMSASLLNTTVEYLLNGTTNTISSNRKISAKSIHNIIFISVIISVLLIVFSAVYYIYSRPVSWDASACSAGYSTYIFDKYNKKLTETFLNGMGDEKENITDIQAVRGSHNTEWKDNKIYIQFDIQYTHKFEGVIKQRVHFTGKRIWIDTYKWSGAAIEI